MGTDGNEHRAPYVLILIFAILAAGILTAGRFYYRRYEEHYRAEVERELSAIAELKVGGIAQYRKERSANASLLSDNPAFSPLVRRFFEDPNGPEAQTLRAWLDEIQTHYPYDRVSLLDPQGVERLSIPEAPEPIASIIAQRAPEVLRSKQVAFQDFYRSEHDQRIYLAMLVPIFSREQSNAPLGVIVLRIDPEQYLYPFMKTWPVPSRSAETLLVRRDGEYALFLNEIKFQSNTALTLRMPLTSEDAPAVQAALGHEGVLQGRDYRGVPVIAAVRGVPDSPWFLVARIDASEVYAPVRERWWTIVVAVVALLLAAATGVGFIWRQQRADFYRAKYQASEALRENESRLRLAISAANVGLYDWDLRTNRVRYSSEWKRQIGYADDEISDDFNEWQSRVHPDDLDRCLRTVRSYVVESWPEFRLEFRIRHKDGSYRWIMSQASVQRDDHGTPVRLLGSHVDVTDVKRREQELRSRNAALEAAANAMVITDRNGLIEWVNPAFTALTGYTPDEAIGKNPRDLVKSGKHDEAFYRTLWRTILAGQVWSGEMVNRRKDGRLFTEEQTITPLRDERGEISQFIAIKQDITARKQAEETLRDSEDRYRDLVENSHDLICTHDLNGNLRSVNEAAMQSTGYARDTLLRMNLADLFDPGQRTELAAYLTEIAARGRAHGIMRIRTASGEARVWEYDNTLRLAGAKHPIVRGMARDVTDLRRAEQQRRALEAQLRVAQKMEALGTLAGGIAHDFNNILGAIIGNVELARQDVDPNNPAIESLNEIRKASQRAKDLVRGILAFSSERAQPRSVIALRPVVEDAVTLLRATLPAGVEIVTSFEPDTPTVLADPTQMHQVLMNLCTNAWHALEGNAGRITIHLDSVTMDAEAASTAVTLRPGHFARLTVADTGTGMDAATLERIFDPFFTTKSVGQGTGLGLSVVHGIMKAHDAAITVTSQPGGGTIFSLYFPAAAAAEGPAAPVCDGVEPRSAPGGQHVLYLDDEETLVFLVTRTLQRLGYRVSGYTDAAAALAAVRADPMRFDLVVTDFNMPRTSGLDVAREVSRLRPDLPVVLASGYITEELRARAVEDGVRQLISPTHSSRASAHPPGAARRHTVLPPYSAPFACSASRSTTRNSSRPSMPRSRSARA